MVTNRQKQVAGVTVAGLLLLGSAYAWSSTNQHKTNELSDTFKDNDVTLVENFVPITDWRKGQEVNKDISVKNNTASETGNNAYVRIQLKEFLEFTDKTEELSTVRYAVTAAGDFAKFQTEAEAQVYATANNLTGAPVQIATTAFEGENNWFIPTNAEATHGQYGKFLVLKVGDGSKSSIIDPSVSKATDIDHQASRHAEDDYSVQKFNSGDATLRNYPNQVKNTPTGGGIDTAKDLTDYISWTFGPNVTMIADFDSDNETPQWVIDPTTGWVYWSQALQPGQTTSNFLDSLTLTLAPKNVSLYYAIHTDLEAVDYNDIETMDSFHEDVRIPESIKTSWQKQPKTVKVSFKDSTGQTDILPTQTISEDNPNLVIPNAPKNEAYFLGWSEEANPDKKTTLYVPETYSDVRSTLSDADKTYLGYAVKPEHEIKSIKEDKTLYAVYAMQKDAASAPADEFIWANSIWRVLNMDMTSSVSGNQALVIKVSALSASEMGLTGPSENAKEVKFHSSDETYYRNNTTDTGYGDSNLKNMIDHYYNTAIKSTANESDVVATNVVNPTYPQISSTDGIEMVETGDSWEPFRPAYDPAPNWSSWQGMLAVYSSYRKEKRFPVTAGSGEKQAFALGNSDILFYNVNNINATNSSLLDFSTATKDDTFWLRTVGSAPDVSGYVRNGRFNNGIQVNEGMPVRPALSVTIK